MAWIGAAIGALGSLIGNVGNWFSANNSAKQQYQYQTQLNAQGYKYSRALQNEQNKFNYQTFQESNEFNREMFNRSAELAASAHQIEVNDMRNAGLNPILSATGGNGANVVSPVQSATTSSGSATQSGGSASAFQKQIRMENFWRGLQYEMDRDMNKSNIRLNESQDRLNMYAADKQHEDAAYTNEQNRQFQEFNPKIQNAIINNYDAQTAKTVTDMLNSVKLLDSQLQVNAAQAWRLRHQALGYSESQSGSSGYNNSNGVGAVNFKFGPAGINTPSINVGRGKNSSFSRSRTW